MKSSLLVLGVMAVLMSGCAHKETITLYGQEEKPSYVDVNLFVDYIDLCSNKMTPVYEHSNANVVNNVPVEISETTNMETNETVATVKYEKLIDGKNTSLQVCFSDSSRQNLRFIYSDVVSETKPLITLETKNIHCQEGETNSSSMTESPNVKFVTCKSK